MEDPNIITQAPESAAPDLVQDVELPDIITLKLNDRIFEIPREKVLTLPQNVLLDLSAKIITSEDQENIDGHSNTVSVNFSPAIFNYVLKTLEFAQETLEPIPLAQFKAPIPPGEQLQPTSTNETEEEWEGDPLEEAPWLVSKTTGIPDILEQRPSFIYLREDLEFYVLSPKHLNWDQVKAQKEFVGQKLAESPENRLLFGGLRNADVIDSPEFHLMQMLVLAGVNESQQWDVREREPCTSKITSVQLVPLVTPESDTDEDAIQALQKLILFWRKPAKKCWWNQFDMKINDENVNIHTRRVWTLELSILGVE